MQLVAKILAGIDQGPAPSRAHAEVRLQVELHPLWDVHVVWGITQQRWPGLGRWIASFRSWMILRWCTLFLRLILKHMYQTLKTRSRIKHPQTSTGQAKEAQLGDMIAFHIHHWVQIVPTSLSQAATYSLESTKPSISNKFGSRLNDLSRVIADLLAIFDTCARDLYKRPSQATTNSPEDPEESMNTPS